MTLGAGSAAHVAVFAVVPALRRRRQPDTAARGQILGTLSALWCPRLAVPEHMDARRRDVEVAFKSAPDGKDAFAREPTVVFLRSFGTRMALENHMQARAARIRENLTERPESARRLTGGDPRFLSQSGSQAGSGRERRSRRPQWSAAPSF